MRAASPFVEGSVWKKFHIVGLQNRLIHNITKSTFSLISAYCHKIFSWLRVYPVRF
jgi:hypothetical protein